MGSGQGHPALTEPRPRSGAFGFALAHPILFSALAGILLRIAYHAGFVRSPLAARPILDAELYDAIARALAAGDWLGAGSPGQPFYFNPLFPYLLGAIYHAFGPASAAVHWVQHGLGIGTVGLISAAAWISFGRGAALAAGLLAATYRPFLLREELLVSEPLVVFLGALGLVLTLRAGKSRWMALAAGLALGLGLLARPTLLPIAALQWLGGGLPRPHPFFKFKESDRGVRTGAAVAVLIAALGIALAVAPATVRNALVAGKPLVLITAHGGETFYVGNRQGADGSNLQPDFVRSGPRTEHEDFRREASRRLGREVSLATASDFWQRQAWSEIAADPGAWLRLLGKKAWLLVNNYEKGDNEDPATIRSLIPAAALPLPGFGLLLALALLGMLSAMGWAGFPARPDGRATSLLVLAALAYALGCLAFFVTGRYRLPLAVPLAVLAGEGLRAGFAAARRPTRRMAPAAAVFAGALAVCHWPLPAADRNDPAVAAVNLGVLYEAQGDFPQAIGAYRRAIGLAPELGLAYFNLGVAERRQGHLAAADSAFRAGLALDPRNADALDQLGMTHEQAGDLETARTLYERALAVDPAHARTYRDLGRLHVLRGDDAAAIAAWEHALALAPGDSVTAARLAALKARPPEAPGSR